jgi:hypothetical protein
MKNIFAPQAFRKLNRTTGIGCWVVLAGPTSFAAKDLGRKKTAL